MARLACTYRANGASINSISATMRTYPHSVMKALRSAARRKFRKETERQAALEVERKAKERERSRARRARAKEVAHAEGSP